VKKLFLALSTMVILGATPLLAEGDGSGSQFDLHVDVFPLFFDILSVGGEAALPVKNMSVAADIQYSPNFFWVTNITLFDLSARVRYYIGDFLTFPMPDFLNFLKKGPISGAFVGVGGSFNTLSESWGGVTWTATSFGVIIETGSKYFFDKHFYAEGVIGLDIQTPTTWTVSSGSYNGSFSGSAYSPSAFYSNVSFGYAF